MTSTLLIVLGLVCLCLAAHSFRPEWFAALFPGRLPHNRLINDLPARTAVERLRASPKTDVTFATSKAFWKDSGFERIYSAYHVFYEQKKCELIEELGPPSFDGNWASDDYPVWAVGECVTSWGSGEDAIYLRLHHEDREVPVQVALVSPLSSSSNHEPESIYKDLREVARRHRGT